MDPRIRIRIHTKMTWIRNTATSSVADPGCLSRILLFSIPDHGSASKNLSILTKKNKKMVSKLKKIWFGLLIPDPGSGCWLSTHPGSRIQGSKRHRIPDPDPQHRLQVPSKMDTYRYKLLAEVAHHLYGSGHSESVPFLWTCMRQSPE